MFKSKNSSRVKIPLTERRSLVPLLGNINGSFAVCHNTFKLKPEYHRIFPQPHSASNGATVNQ